MGRIGAWLLVLAAATPSSHGQTSLSVQKAELSIPFGAAAGTLVLVDDYLVFVDEGELGASFAVARGDIKDVRAEGEAVIVELARAVRDRSGSRSRISFRLTGEGGAGMLGAWYGGAAPPRSSPGPAPAEGGSGDITLQASHNHRLGSCSGSLLIRQDRIVYESVDNVSHSREWPLTEIRKVEQDNPYELRVEPFRGGGYKFNLSGGGLAAEAFRDLVDRITKSRAERRTP